MTSRKDMGTVIINVHLGNAPLFDILADEKLTARPGECRWNAHGAGPDDKAFLLEILGKVASAYAQALAVRMCTDDSKIVPDSECR